MAEAVFQVPQDTSLDSFGSISKITGNFLGDGSQKLAFQNSDWPGLKPKLKRSKPRCLDLSETYGRLTNNQGMQKFHQVTMYFRETKAFTNGVVTKEGADYGPFIITSNLPDTLTYKVGGSWNKPLDWTADSMLDLALRTASNNERSLRTMASTGLMWTNTEPLEIQFTIHAFDDTASDSNTNIQECLRILGAYTLPDEGDSIYRNVPAGVDLNFTVETDGKGKRPILGSSEGTKTINDFTTKGKKLDVLIGGMLFLESVVIKQFTVNYTNTKHMLLHNWQESELGYNAENWGVGQRLLPMTADITIVLTTLRGLSRVNYNKMLILNNEVGCGEYDNQHQSADETIAGNLDLRGTGAIGRQADKLV